MTVSADFSFQLGTGGFIVNSVDPVTYPTVDILEIVGLDSAPIRTTVKDREGTDGAYVDAEFDQARTIVLSGVLYDDCAHTEITLDQLKLDWAPSKVPVQLSYQMPGIGQRMLWVKPGGVKYDITQLRRLGICEVAFTAIAGDPRIYANFETLRTFKVTDVLQTGYGFNRSFNFGFGGLIASGFGPGLVINAGNRSTPAVFRMYGPFTNPHIMNLTTGDEMAFDMIVSSPADYLEVDTATFGVHFVGPFGIQNRRDTLRRPSWFDLEPGNNYIGFRVEGGASLVTHMDVLYRSAWR